MIVSVIESIVVCLSLTVKDRHPFVNASGVNINRLRLNAVENLAKYLNIVNYSIVI